MHHPTDRITHTTAFVTPVVEHWLEREIAQWVHPMKDCKEEVYGSSKYLCVSLIVTIIILARMRLTDYTRGSMQSQGELGEKKTSLEIAIGEQFNMFEIRRDN